MLMVLLVSPIVLQAQESCGWMSEKDLDRLLPEAAPWSVFVGGKVGSCKFTGTGRGDAGATVIGANQMFKANATEAAEFVKKLKGSMAAGNTVEPMPALGEHGFRWMPKSGRSISYMGHYKQVAITGQLVLSVGATPETYAQGAEGFMRAALAVADDKQAAAASGCPYFDDAVMRRLLPGAGYSQQVFGNNSCMAQDGAGMVMILTITSNPSDSVAAALRDGSCEWSPLADAGPGVSIGKHCQGGRPRAILEVVLSNRLLHYALAPGREPTASEFALLGDLARAVRAAQP
jgi:hypothetical protein